MSVKQQTCVEGRCAACLAYSSHVTFHPHFLSSAAFDTLFLTLMM
jgi:hypothetical protein